MQPGKEQLSAQQSLEIITAMIRQAEGKIQRNSFYFLLWGWVVVAANAGVYLLGYSGYDKPYLAWLIAIPAWIATIIRGLGADRSEPFITHLDKIQMGMWITYGIVIATVIPFGNKIHFQIYPVITLVTAIPTLTSGIVLRFNALIAGGIFFWAAGIASFLVPFTLQPLINALAIVVGYLVPGYLLKNRSA
jgi:hypothetical protein